MNEKIGSILKIVRGAMGVNAAKFKEPWEVKPSAHYLMGGIRATENGNALDHNGEPIDGLYVAGQALGGLHGSNRLGSTSLAEAIVFGRRAGAEAARYSTRVDHLDWADFDESESELIKFYRGVMESDNLKGDGAYPISLIRELQAACWQGIGPAREKQPMREVLNTIESIKAKLTDTQVSKQSVWNQTFIDYVECRNLLFVAECIAKSALQRPNSLGAHVRLDDDKKASVIVRPTPFSITSFYHPQNGVEVGRLAREKSPYSSYLRLITKQKLKSMFLALLAHAPEKVRDMVLVRVYQKALSSQEAAE